MSRFYFLLWLRWVVRLSICSVTLALLLSGVVTTYIYLKQGAIDIDSEVVTALLHVGVFWFSLFWSLTLLIALFRSLKYIFNICISGYVLKLYSCDKQPIEAVGYGDLIKVWRRWFMLLIWMVGSMMILTLSYIYLFTSLDGVWEWFSIYWLFGFISMSGYLSFIFMSARCKSVGIEKC